MLPTPVLEQWTGVDRRDDLFLGEAELLACRLVAEGCTLAAPLFFHPSPSFRLHCPVSAAQRMYSGSCPARATVEDLDRPAGTVVALPSSARGRCLFPPRESVPARPVAVGRGFGALEALGELGGSSDVAVAGGELVDVAGVGAEGESGSSAGSLELTTTNSPGKLTECGPKAAPEAGRRRSGRLRRVGWLDVRGSGQVGARVVQASLPG